MIDMLLKLLLCYLLGSISGSLLLGRLRGVDIRDAGSGNAGGTNAFRTQGFLFALGVVIIDIGKGVLAAAWIPGLSFASPEYTGLNAALGCGLAAVAGHCYPLWHGFRGGKGAATMVGALIVVAPWSLILLIVSWLLTLILTGYVGLATMIAGISLLPSTWLWGPDPAPAMLWIFMAVLVGFLIFTHRSNIRNMRQGQEHRFQRIMAKNWFKGT